MTSRRSAAAHVFAENLEDPVLVDEDRHHLTRVLRLRAGEVVTVSDGRGSWRSFRIVDDSLSLEALGDVLTEIRPTPEIGVVFALTKGDRPELVVQKLTELGVDHVWPMVTERTVVRRDPSRMAKQHERLTKVAREAAMQSRAVFIPRLHAVQTSLAAALNAVGGAELVGTIALAEPDGVTLSAEVSVVIIGPEGGFTADELECVGMKVSLPGGILRAETAAIAAGVLLSENRRRVRGS